MYLNKNYYQFVKNCKKQRQYMIKQEENYRNRKRAKQFSKKIINCIIYFY